MENKMFTYKWNLTDLEKVKLTVKDYLGEDILIIGFDSITRKLRVIDYKNKSIDFNFKMLNLYLI